MTKNRRQFHRMPAIDPHCFITIDGLKYEAIAINESIGGLSMQFSNPEPIAFLQSVTITQNGQTEEGVCRSIFRIENNDFQIGIQRKDKRVALGSDMAPHWLLAHFVQAQGQWIFCEILEHVDEENVRIRLIDGKQFTTQRNKTVLLTRDERAKMLQVTDKYKKVSNIYRLLDPRLQIGSHSEILRWEFERGLAAAEPAMPEVNLNSQV